MNKAFEVICNRILSMGEPAAIAFAVKWVRAHKLPRFDAKAGHISSKPRASREEERIAIECIHIIFLQAKQEEERRKQEGK